MPRRWKEDRYREREDHRNIEQDGRCSRRREARQRVENAAVKRHQRDQKGDMET